MSTAQVIGTSTGNGGVDSGVVVLAAIALLLLMTVTPQRRDKFRRPGAPPPRQGIGGVLIGAAILVVLFGLAVSGGTG